MAAEDYFTDPINYPLTVPSGTSAISMGVAGWAAIIASLYPASSCADIVAQADGLNSVPYAAYATGVYPVPADLDFIVATLVLDTATVEVIQLRQGATLLAEYQWVWNIDGTKSGEVVTIHVANYVLTGAETLNTSIGTPGTGNQQTVTLPFLSYQSIDAQGLVGFLIPACAVVTTVAPSIGSGVKCANFSKIFNPLGIPLRSK